MSPKQEIKWLFEYYQEKIRCFIPNSETKLIMLMPQLEYLAKNNKLAFSLFNDICFSGILPEYDDKWFPQICILK